MSKNQFLKTQNAKIVDFNQKPITLKGINLGGWLMMEAYFMHSPNLPEQKFKKEFQAALGKKSLEDFEKSFRDSFIVEEDIKRLKSQGFNVLRVPFNYRLVEKGFNKFDLDGVKYLDRVVKWAEKYRIWVILDLHAAPGCQNHDWHSDSYGKAELWTKSLNQKRTFAIWKFLANRYKDKSYVAGYDLLNEAVLGDGKKLDGFYKKLIKTIRSVDKNHILFIEGNNWAMDLNILSEYEDDNYVLSIHHYVPLDFAFNFIPQLQYKKLWNKAKAKKYLKKYQKISNDRKVPIFVGEFGVNSRGGLYDEHVWLKDTLQAFKELGFHWTYWTYKAVKNNAFPDGVFSYYENPPWVCREGPKMGWDTYKNHWKDKKAKMISSWKTKSFKANTNILKTLKEHVK